MRTNWYETFFHGLALELWRRAIAHQPTGAEVDFLVEALARPSGARILDVPCGNLQMTITSREEEHVFARGGQTETKASVHWVYTAAEIRRLLDGAGLEVLALYGGLDRRPFGLGAQELFVVAQKRV